MLRLGRRVVAVLTLVTFWPGLAFGQSTKAGVVTTLEGSVTAQRTAPPRQIPLKFKDDVYIDDRITTGDRALARMLLGGKAIVTVRERSVVTITETPGKSTIGLVAGKIGLAVAKERMRPGESVEIKTPNALCAVRGTVVVAEVQSTTTQAGVGASGLVTYFYVLRGAIEAFQLVLGTNTPIGGALAVNTLQSFTRAGSAPPHVGNITPGQMGQITGGLTPSGMQQGQGTTEQVVNQQQGAAGRVLELLGFPVTPPPVVIPRTTTPTPPPQSPPPSGTARVTLDSATVTQPAGGALLSIGPGGGSPPAPTVFRGNVQVGADGLLNIGPGFTLDVPLLLVHDSTLNTPSSTVLSAQGALTSTGSGGLLNFDPTTVGAATIANIGGTLNLAGPLLTDTGGTYNVSGDFITVPGTLKQTGAPTEASPALMIFNGSAVNSGTDESHTNLFRVTGGAVDLDRPLLKANASAITQKGFALLEVAGSGDVIGQLTGHSTNPFINLSGGSLTLHPGVYGVFIENAIVTLTGGLLTAVGTSLSTAMDRPLIQLAHGALTTGAGAVLDLTGVGLNLGTQPVVSMTSASAFTIGGGGIKLSSGSLTADALLQSDGSNNLVTVNGTILDLTSSTVNLRASYATTGESNTDSIAVAPGGQPLFKLVDSHLTLTGDNLVRIGGIGTTDMPLVVATGNSSVQVSGDLVKLTGALTTTTSAALVDFTGPSVSVQAMLSVGQAMLDLVGANTASDPDAGITVGTDKPLAHDGVLFHATDTIATVGQVMRIDTALLEATKPVVDLVRSKLTVQGNALDLVDKAKLAAGTTQAPINAVFNLNASTLNVGGSLVNVVNSFMRVFGNLFSLTGGSTLNINGGALVMASGNGIFQLTGGSLGVFGTGANTLTITATPGAAGHISTTIPNLAGVPVALLNGAQASQVTVTPGFTPFSGVGGGNSVNIVPNGAALVVNGTSAKIKLGP